RASARQQLLIARGLRRHHKRNPDVRPEPDHQPVKTLRRSADDIEAEAVQRHRRSDDIEIRAKPLPPKSVTQHDDRMRSGRAIFFGSESPPQRRFDSQTGEEIAGDILALNNFALSFSTPAYERRAVGKSRHFS